MKKLIKIYNKNFDSNYIDDDLINNKINYFVDIFNLSSKEDLFLMLSKVNNTKFDLTAFKLNYINSVPNYKYDLVDILNKSSFLDGIIKKSLQSVNKEILYFSKFFEPIINSFIVDFFIKIKKFKNIEINNFLSLFIKDLVKFYFNISYKALITYVKNNNNLNTTDINFIKKLSYNDILFFYNEYLPLTDILIHKSLQITNYYIEILKKIESFNLRIISFNSLFDYSFNNSKSIIIINTESKKFIYKPKFSGVDISFNKLLMFINKKINSNPNYNLLDFKSFKIIKYSDDFIIAEYINYDEVNNINQIKNYYKRIGQYLFLFRIFNSTDIHAGNIINHNEYPVIIDIETLFSQKLKKEVEDNKLINYNDELINILTNINFLPNKNLNVSGIFTKRDKNTNINSIKIEVKNDNIYIKYEELTIKNYKNILRLNGDIINYKDYISEILFGYKNMYKFFYYNKKSLYKFILSNFKNKKYRIVLRPKSYYLSLLNISYHPDLLKSRFDRELFFSILSLDKKTKFDSKLFIKNEYNSILNSDIYLLFSNTSKNIIYDNDNNYINYIISSTFPNTLNSIRSLEIKNVNRDLKIINNLLIIN